MSAFVKKVSSICCRLFVESIYIQTEKFNLCFHRLAKKKQLHIKTWAAMLKSWYRLHFLYLSWLMILLTHPDVDRVSHSKIVSHLTQGSSPILSRDIKLGRFAHLGNRSWDRWCSHCKTEYKIGCHGTYTLLEMMILGGAFLKEKARALNHGTWKLPWEYFFPGFKLSTTSPLPQQNWVNLIRIWSIVSNSIFRLSKNTMLERILSRL